mgnify:CR=1 FL=1
MKNVTEMTIAELNAERARLNDVINATLAGMTNENEQNLQERLDNIVLELHDRVSKGMVGVERDGYTAQLSIGRGTMASTMVLTVAFQKNRDTALTALIKKIITEDYELALQMKDILDEKIQERDEAMIGLAEINCEERSYDDMDGDHASALASAGWGTDEDYGGDDRI